MRYLHELPRRVLTVPALFLVFSIGFSVRAQIPLGSNSNSGNAEAEASPTSDATPAPTPIAASDINARAEETREQIDQIQKGLTLSPSVSAISGSVLVLTREIDNKSAETKNLLAARPSLETLRTVEQEWQAIAQPLPAWKSELKTTIDTFDANLSVLNALGEAWKLTLAKLEGRLSESGTEPEIQVPTEVLKTVRGMIAAIADSEKKVAARKSEVLAIQTRVSKQDNRVNEMLKSVSDVRDEALSHLLVRDSPPIWLANTKASSIGEIFTEAGASYRTQFNRIRDYLLAKSDAFVLHTFLFLLLAGFLIWARRRLRPMVEIDPELKPAFSVFELPLAGALIIAVMLSGRFYPQAPRMLLAIFGAVALVPGVLYLRRILEKPLFPIFNALLVLYLVDLIRHITATLPFLSRIIFTVEMFGVIGFLLWFLWAKSVRDEGDIEYQNVFIVIRKAIPVFLVLFSVAIIASIFGYLSLARTIGNSVLSSSYTALIIYAAVQIVKSLVVFALRVRPLSELGMVKNHRALVTQKLFRVLKWAGIITWLFLTLNLFSIRQNAFEYVGDWFSTSVSIGSISFTAGDIVVFGFTVWLSFALSKLIRFVLDEDIYPRVNLGGGVSYAISTILHYVLLLVGLMLAIAAAGIDLTKFTILAGAFGVGIGFGMQAIVNNFVSGLILLFERPVKVDDFVQVGTHLGELKRIGLRASVLRTLDGSEVILPNGQLISEEVTNWTFSDPERRLEIDVGVAYGSDPRQVMDILNKIGRENEDILQSPEPRSIFLGFGESSLNFQLRAWTDKSDQWVVVQSDLSLSIHDKLKEADIEIPFPQRDLHLRGIDQETMTAIVRKRKNETED